MDTRQVYHSDAPTDEVRDGWGPYRSPDPLWRVSRERRRHLTLDVAEAMSVSALVGEFDLAQE